MNRKLYLIAALFATQQAVAQIPEDALRMSWNVPSGSARSQAIGGAMGALGGEITNLWVNPAGLGFYKTSEIVLSPGLTLARSKGSFRETEASADGLNRFNLGASGLVFGYNDHYSKWTSKAFSIGVNRVANFAGTYYYKGTNDYSSFTEPLANEFFNYYSNAKDRNPSLPNLDIINMAIDDRSVSLQTRMALHNYLVDVDDNTNTVFSRAEDLGVVNQERKIITKGGITELALGFASNMDDKFYWGLGIGIPIVNYQRSSTYTESDITSDLNDFNYATYKEEFSSKGVGVNAKLGVIFKPMEKLRLGVAIHSPSLYALKDQSSSMMITDLDNLNNVARIDSVSSSYLNGGSDPTFKYDLVSPWKFLVSGSYVINEVSDISRQKGFISADIEYVTYGSSRFSEAEDNGEREYFKQVNEATKQSYKGALNFRVGGELKFNTIMTRVGFGFYGNPYEDKELKGHKMNISGGLGYRDKGIFVDLTYVHSLHKDVNFPYRVDPPRANTFATVKDNSGNIMLTFGIKL